ncbi:phosphatase PAP2 family protein [Pelagibius sp.]|uniref:phosphatase PAP2 family protein n=1 Tax=Pelagibius sp. TaxID=1931238 RepID=UPI002635EA78|nr:phosphatase PAP2 family protein [Pelagibius sp.]
MDSYTDVQRLERAPSKPGRSLSAAAQSAVGRLLALPNHLGAAIIIVGAFAATVTLIAVIYGAPFSVPRERTSAALGVNAVLPVALTVFLYLSLRICKALLRKAEPSDPPLLRIIAIDLTLMILFVAVTYFHFSLKTWVQVINPNLYDEAYFAVDNAFRPVIEVFYWIRQEYFTLVPGTDRWYQAAFILMFSSSFCSYAVSRHPIYPRFCIGVLLTMSLGALSYLIAPALGPFIYEQGVNADATGAQAGMLRAHEEVLQHGMAWIEAAGPYYFTGALAAMPSLHIAHAAVMTYFAFVARSALTPIFLVICCWVIVESVASRWHYLIDLPFGLLIAVVVVWLTNRICRERPSSLTQTAAA